MKILVGIVVVHASIAAADAPAIDTSASDRSTPDDLDLRLTLSTFLYRELGDDVAPFVDAGAEVENAASVRRYFGDLRVELADGGFVLDGRVRQTTSRVFQSGATGADEYELRSLSYRLGGASTSLTIGRQYIEAAGATKIDGLAFRRRLAKPLEVAIFGGLYPMLGSRSVDTDYPRIVRDNMVGDRILPVVGGLAFDYQTANYHGAIGLADIYVAQDLPVAATEKSRLFATSTGYWRPVSRFDAYHFVLFDIAGQNGARLTNGSAGLVARPMPALQLTASATHVATDVLEIAARNFLADPDLQTPGLVQADAARIRVSQDAARAGASLALAAQRFEVSASAGLHRRPRVVVPFSDDSGSVTFPETRSIDATIGILDRRSIGGTRISLTATAVSPIGNDLPNRARSTSVRLAVARPFVGERGQIEVDVTGARFSSQGSTGMCTSSMDVFACYSATKATTVYSGALATWRIGRDWLLLADAHVGYRDATSQTIAGTTVWPHAFSITSFLRVQWRYH